MNDNSHTNQDNGASETVVPGASTWPELQGLAKSRQILKIKAGKLARNKDQEVVGVQFVYLDVRGFIPESGLATGTTPQSAAGKFIEVVITEAEPPSKGGKNKGGRLIGSHKQAAIRRKLEVLTKGMRVVGVVHKVIADGVLVALKQTVGTDGTREGDLTDVIGLAFKNAVTNKRDADLKALMPEGTEVTAVITGIDPARERVSLSIKAVALDEQLASLELEQPITGTVVSVSKEFGYFIDIGAVDALLSHQQAAGQTFEVGATVDATVLSINSEKKQVGLTKLSKEERERRSQAVQRKRSGGDSGGEKKGRDNRGRGSNNGGRRDGGNSGRREGGNTGSTGTSSERRVARATPKAVTATTTTGGGSKKKVKHAPPARSRKGEVVFSSSTHSNPFQALAAYMQGGKSEEGTGDEKGTGTEIAAPVEPIIDAVAPAASSEVVEAVPPAADQES